MGDTATGGITAGELSGGLMVGTAAAKIGSCSVGVRGAAITSGLGREGGGGEISGAGGTALMGIGGCTVEGGYRLAIGCQGVDFGRSSSRYTQSGRSF